MRIDQFCAQVRAHLLREGVFGRRAEHYIEELREHANLLTGQIIADSPNLQAEEMALRQLGQPNLLARQEAVELRRKSWWARHPGLANLTLYFGATVALAVVDFAIMAGFGSVYPQKRVFPPWDGVCAYTFSTFFNYAPVLLALYFLLWFGRRFSCGWASLLMVSSAVGLACANLTGSIHHAPAKLHPYSMTTELGPVPLSIQMILENILQHPPSLVQHIPWYRFAGLFYSLPQLLMPVLFVAVWWRRSLWHADRELAQAGLEKT
jgi:hypothetical protein